MSKHPAFDAFVAKIDDFNRLKLPTQQFDDAPARAELLTKCEDDLAGHGYVNICIAGRMWTFSAKQPGVLHTQEGAQVTDWFDHASMGISVADVEKALA